jgi:hypothetical protein
VTDFGERKKEGRKSPRRFVVPLPNFHVFDPVFVAAYVVTPTNVDPMRVNGAKIITTLNDEDI